MGSQVRGFMGAHGFMGVCVYKFMGSWVHRVMDSLVHGLMGAGVMGIWIHGFRLLDA